MSTPSDLKAASASFTTWWLYKASLREAVTRLKIEEERELLPALGQRLHIFFYSFP
jgi:predicted amidophosphoribosyltransferase